MSPVQLLYCFVWGLVYVDQGLLSSNGVTGTRSSDPSNSAVGAGDQGGLEVSSKISVSTKVCARYEWCGLGGRLMAVASLTPDTVYTVGDGIGLSWRRRCWQSGSSWHACVRSWPKL